MPKRHRQFPPQSCPSSGSSSWQNLWHQVIVVSAIVVVGGVQRRKDNAQCYGICVASVNIRGSRVALVIARSSIVVLPISWGGRRSVIAPIIVPPLL
jgi:hypothetical protein